MIDFISILENSVNFITVVLKHGMSQNDP